MKAPVSVRTCGALALALFLCLALWPFPAAAQTPEPEEAMPADLRSLVEAELAFSRLSQEQGMKEAFIANADADGVVFRRTAVNAVSEWRNTTPAPTALLTWRPVFADVSRAGDLGYTTGPYELRDKPTDDAPSGTGHYFTVWRRRPGGVWKFMLDMGVRHAPTAGPPSGLQYPHARRRSGATRPVFGRDEAARRSLLAAEQKLARLSESKDAATALLAHASKELRLYRQDMPPFVGRDAARAAASGAPGRASWKVVGSGAASSGDLGYVYGAYEMKGKSPGAATGEAGNYVRVWKREGAGPWRVVLDITNPAPR